MSSTSASYDEEAYQEAQMDPIEFHIHILKKKILGCKEGFEKGEICLADVLKSLKEFADNVDKIKGLYGQKKEQVVKMRAILQDACHFAL